MLVKFINENNIKHANQKNILMFENKQVINPRDEDFIPCYRNSDGEIGLYDSINDIFYTNQGTGTFTKGPDVN